jgi:glycosyltransferase involved in cell wall biosynthesis
VASGNLRVLHVLNTLETGGAEHLVLNLARAIDRDQFELSACSLQGDGEIGAELRGLGVATYSFRRRPGLDAGLVPALVALVRRIGAHVVHTHNVAPWLYAGLAGRLAGAQVCHTEHSGLFPEQRALRRLERALGLVSKAVICDGEEVRRQLVDEQRLSPRNVVTIHNGVDTARFGRACDVEARRRSLGLPPGAPVVGTVARLQPVKDQGTLIAAFAQVAAALPEARLVFVGDGPERPKLEALAAAPALAGRVLFLGRRTDVADLLPVFDVFALPSLSEGLPLTLLEAMAAGLPCVATAVGVMPEAIVPERTGLLVPVGDVAALSAALLRILRDRDLGRAWGQAGQRRARELFDLRVMTRRYQDLYAA